MIHMLRNFIFLSLLAILLASCASPNTFHVTPTAFPPSMTASPKSGSIFLPAISDAHPTTIPAGIEVPFETIDQRERPDRTIGYELKEPGMVILTNVDEVSSIEKFIYTSTYKTLQNQDFYEYFIIAVFQGWKPTNFYSITIDKVWRNDNTLTVQVTTVEPRPDLKKDDIVTSPYYIIKIKKGNDLRGLFIFQMVDKGRQVVSVEKLIP